MSKTAIIWVLENNVNQLVHALKYYRDREYRVLLLSLTKDYVSVPSDSVRVIPITRYLENEHFEVRPIATDWMQRISKTIIHKFGSKLTIADSPAWWLIDISLQEKTFLIIRLIHALERAFTIEHPEAFTVIGTHDQIVWKRKLIQDFFRGRGVQDYDFSDITEAPFPEEEGSNHVHIETRLKKRGIRLFKYDSSDSIEKKGFTDSFSTILRKCNSLLLKLSKKAVHVVRTILIILTFSSFAMAGALVLTIVSPVILLVMFFKLLPVEKRQFHYMLIIAKELLNRAAGKANAVRNRLADIRNKAKRLVFKVYVNLETTFKSITRKKRDTVLFLQDAGDIRVRAFLSDQKTGHYNPYMEGVLDRLKDLSFLTVKVLSVGSRTDRNSLLLYSLAQNELIHAGNIRNSAQEFWKAISVDPDIRNSFEYNQVDLWNYFSEDIELLLKYTVDNYIYARAFEKFLRILKPKAIITCNFEGVMKKFVLSALRLNIPVAGIQQALGPYVHSLNRSLHGYYSGNGDAMRYPVPNRLLLWGDFHKKKLDDYGYDSKMLEVTGHARLDTYVNEKNQLSRHTILGKLGIPDSDAKVIIFTGLYRVLGTSILLKEDFLRIIKVLTEIVNQFEEYYLVIKPWHGESVENIATLLEEAIDHGNSKVILMHPKSEVHNVEILKASDIIVGSLSSIYAEAVVMDNVSVLLDYPESRYYFEDEYTNLMKQFAINCQSPDDLKEQIISIIHWDDETRETHLAKARSVIENLFGPLDGQSASRMASALAMLAP